MTSGISPGITSWSVQSGEHLEPGDPGSNLNKSRKVRCERTSGNYKTH